MMRRLGVALALAISSATRSICFVIQVKPLPSLHHEHWGRRLRASYFDENDVDMMEMVIGGSRYEMVDLPDSMLDTTLYVGNLCEFVTDDMLSSLFQEVSSLNFIPACVARRPNFSSMQYGFVTFPTIEEKEAAIVRFSGYKLNDRRLRLEEIQDKPNRVRVPEKLVFYAVGQEKRTRDGSKNTLRKANNSRNPERDDNVQKPSRRQKAKKTTIPTASSLLSKLNDSDKVAFERAVRKGYISLDGYYRSKSPLLSTHRIWCNTQDIPQIILRKAFSGKILDDLIIDFSPLSINHLSINGAVVDQFLTTWKIKLMTVAQSLGMNLKSMTDHGNEDESIEHTFEVTEEMEGCNIETCRLVFEGSRESSKAMARQVVSLWDEESLLSDDDDTDHDEQEEWGKIKNKAKRKYR